jgi:hypothetical protein
MMMRGDGENSFESSTFLMNCFSICSVTVKSAMTPSFMGRIAVMLPGVRPSICFAASPTSWITRYRWDRLLTYRHDRRFIQHDALPADIDQRVGGAEVDREIAGEITFE